MHSFFLTFIENLLCVWHWGYHSWEDMESVVKKSIVSTPGSRLLMELQDRKSAAIISLTQGAGCSRNIACRLQPLGCKLFSFPIYKSFRPEEEATPAPARRWRPAADNASTWLMLEVPLGGALFWLAEPSGWVPGFRGFCNRKAPWASRCCLAGLGCLLDRRGDSFSWTFGVGSDRFDPRFPEGVSAPLPVYSRSSGLIAGRAPGAQGRRGWWYRWRRNCKAFLRRWWWVKGSGIQDYGRARGSLGAAD